MATDIMRLKNLSALNSLEGRKRKGSNHYFVCSAILLFLAPEKINVIENKHFIYHYTKRSGFLCLCVRHVS